MKKNLQFTPPSKDILPDEHNYFTFIKKVVRHRCRQSGYRRITPSPLQAANTYEELFGPESDMVKNACRIEQNGQSFFLSQDLSGDLARSYTEHNMSLLAQPVELYAIENSFLTEERNGQIQLTPSLQLAVENIGEADPAIDAQVIFLAWRILKDLGILSQISLQINTIGDRESRQQYSEDLKNFYFGKEHSLCRNCQKILHSNPLRLLNCKEEDCQIIAKLAPKFDNVLNSESKKHHAAVLEFLDELKIEYTNNPHLIPNIDNQSKTCFEFWDISSAEPMTLIQGGHHDDFLSTMLSKEISAIGFTASFEKIEDLMKRENITIKDKDIVHVFVAQLGVDAKKKCVSLLMKLRDAGIHAVGALGKGSMREQLELAEKFKAPWTVLMGQIEVLEEIAIIRNMKIGSQEIVRYDDVIEELINRIGEGDLDKYTVGVEETIYKDGEEQDSVEE